MSKFQAIQAAHEILQDPTSKARYDADRRKAGLGGGAFTKPNVPPRSSGTNPMYQTTSAYPPPPRRTPNPTNTWRSTAQGSSGADRYTNFPRPAPTSKKSTTDPANVFNAWQNMKSQTQQPREPPQRPKPPPPPRRDTRFPTEEEIRAGMNHRPPPSQTYGRSAWAEHNTSTSQTNASPNVGRSNTTKSPRKGGFDPSSTGDEGQAGSYANYSSFRRKSADAPYFPPPPPRSSSQNAETDPPFNEGTRTKTPYSTHIGQQTFSSGDDVRRTTSAPQTHTTSEPGPQFRRSTRKTGTGTARRPFIVQSSSDDDSDSEDDSASPTPQPADGNAEAPEASAPRSFTRPKKTPNPPSRQFKNGVPPMATDEPSGANNVDDASPAPDKPTMYDQRFSTPSSAQQKNMPSPIFPFGSNFQQTKSPEFMPVWAFPSTIRPFKRSHSAAQRAWHHDLAAKDDAISSRKTQQAFSKKQSRSNTSPGDLIDLTSSPTSPPELPPQSKKPCFTKEDATGLYLLNTHILHHGPKLTYNINRFTMPINADTFRPNVAKSHSEDNINTAFAPSQWAGAFTSNNVFAAAQPTGRKSNPPSRTGSRAFRSRSSVNSMRETAQQQQQGGAGPAQEARAPSPSPQPVKYSAEDWKKTFKDPSWVWDPDAARTSSPGKAESRPTSRSNSSSTRKGSRVANKIPVNAPKPVSVADEVEEAASQAQPVDEMDVDSTPPATNNVPGPAPTQNPRVYPVNTSQLRQNDTGISPSEPKASPSGGTFNVRLDDLTEAVDPQPPPTDNLNLPSLPRAPSTPTKLTLPSWQAYCNLFSTYLSKFDTFNNTLLSHFATRQQNAQSLIKSGVRALEAVGEGSGAEGWRSYSRGVREDERVREHWVLGCERHTVAVQEFEGVRERVRVLSEGAGLPEA